MTDLQKIINGIIILILCGVLISAYGIEVLWKEVPCPLCMLQRLCMISAAIGLLLNLTCGIKMAHYGFTLLSCIAGGTVALRQISLHVCPGFPLFGFPVLGLSLYTWSFVVFVCVGLSVAGLLFLYNPNRDQSEEFKYPLIKNSVSIILFLIAFANGITTFLHCGLGACSE